MRPGRVLALLLAVVLIAAGGFLLLAGNGAFDDGLSRSWATIGGVFAGLGVALVIVVVQNGSRAR